MSSKRSYIKYSEETLERALEDIRTGETTINEASKIYSIPRGTLQNKIKHWHMNPVGKPKVFSEDEENKMVDYILLCASWGFPMTKLDVRYLAKSYIDKLGREVTFFNKNLPGPDWMDKFLSRHSNRLTQRLANNIKRNRASSRCNDNLKAGFEACGICPFNPKRVLKKVPGEEDTESQDSSVCSEALSESVLAVLQTMRFDKKDKPKVSKKKLKVDAGKSITEICATDSDDEAPRSSKSAKKSRVVQIEEESESEEENAGESKICLVEDVSEIEHEFVAVIYENHWWVGLAEEICPDQSDIKIKFMHPHGPSKAYQWPGKEDMCWVKLENDQYSRHHQAPFRRVV
uniref:HTH psq-type domain-containing protein n=1 Tax=Romanomermis culicivorax TaxID=13658 RepID=A0A915IQR8_ROMCU